MLDFYEVWGREILKKRIAIGVAVFLGVLLIVQFIYNVLTEVPPKTIEDYAYQYVVDRFNYLPQNVERAYYSRYQYKFAGYDIIVSKEIEEVKELRLVSFFKPEKIMRDTKNRRLLKVVGIRITGKLARNSIVDVQVKKTVILLKAIGLKFTIEKIM